MQPTDPPSPPPVTPAPPASHRPASLLRRVGKVFLVLVALGALIAIPATWWAWDHYSKAAAQIDLGRLREVTEGTPVTDRHGQPAGTLFAENRKFVRLPEVPQHLIDALIATEDARFYEHHGMDYRGIARAMVKNVTSMSVKQGGSTITQQLARQAFELKGRTLHRKLLESFVAHRIENEHTKDEILECYLNRIYFGAGFYGIGSAARGYFNKELKDVNLEEAAMLVGIIKAPVSFSPFRNLAAAKKTRDLTLDRMRSLKMIDPMRCSEAQAAPVAVMPENTRLGRQNYLLAAVERDLESLEENGVTGPWRSVAVTVDAKLQAQLDAMVGRHVSRVEEQLQGAQPGEGKLQGAAIIIDNRTGAVLATCGGRDFLSSPFDRALKGLRPAGTAFLPMTYAAVLADKPALVSTHVLDAPLDNRRIMIGGDEGTLGEWGAERSRPVYEGYVPALYGLAEGKTGVTVRLASEAGLDAIKAELERCGFTSPLREYSSVVLGSSTVRLVDLARAYASLAQGGAIPPPPQLVTQAIPSSGRGASVPKAAAPGRVFNPDAAMQVRHVLVAALEKEDLQPVLRQHGLATRGLAGWGGTAHGFTDAWFVGFDQNITCAVWMGHDETRRMGDEAWAKVTAFPLWAEAMAAASDNQARGWPLRDGEPMVCLKSGCLATEECRRTASDVAALTTEAATQFKTPCPGHTALHSRLARVSAMEKEVLVMDEATAPVASPRATPVQPREPALIGEDVYKVYVTGASGR